MKFDLLQSGPRRWLADSVFAAVEEEYVSPIFERVNIIRTQCEYIIRHLLHVLRA